MNTLKWNQWQILYFYGHFLCNVSEMDVVDLLWNVEMEVFCSYYQYFFSFFSLLILFTFIIIGKKYNETELFGY